MPRKTKPPAKAISTPKLDVSQELLDHLVKGPMTQAELESMFRSLKKAVIERAIGAEMSDRQGESKPEGQFNKFKRHAIRARNISTVTALIPWSWRQRRLSKLRAGRFLQFRDHLTGFTGGAEGEDCYTPFFLLASLRALTPL
jgi:hypothetical protein